jgi:hypothetical protein
MRFGISQEALERDRLIPQLFALYRRAFLHVQAFHQSVEQECGCRTNASGFGSQIPFCISDIAKAVFRIASWESMKKQTIEPPMYSQPP